MISVYGLEKLYQKDHMTVHALRDINLDIDEGDIFGLIGRTGSGKSTLLRCLQCLERPTTGTVMVDNCNLTSLAANALKHMQRNMGMVFQTFNLLASRNVYDNIALPLEIMNVSKLEIDKQVQNLLSLTHLTDYAHHFPSQLNNGQKQRVALARAVSHHPKILFVDEATPALDNKSAYSFIQLLREVHKRFKMTMVLVSQEMEMIKLLCNRFAVLHKGEIIEQGKILQLFSNPQTDVSKEFVKFHSRQEIPLGIRNRLRPKQQDNYNPVLRLTLTGPEGQEPVIAELIQKFNLKINIMQAYLENIQNENIGVIIAEVLGSNQNVEEAKEFLHSKGHFAEGLGYVPRSL